MFRYLFLFILLLTSSSVSQAQDKAADKEERKKIKRLNSTPRKATIMSALVPGLGQIYNKQYWKAPIAWVGLGVTGYLYISNKTFFNEFKSEYQKFAPSSIDTNNTIINGYHVANKSADQLAKERDTYRYYRDLDLLIGLGIYALNIIDANVGAHLKEFNINDNLSLKVKPLLYANINRQFTTGLTLTFRFKK
ncbi:MAG TPA: DUF5683 domain-containing protein [Cytophagaceae bacterium]|jgi:hypothetical protein|nr:DUF5683 domain-containing protein [Cytophagaceae bacterium]